MFIVKLADDFYIGNMCPTSFETYAKRYETSKGAKIALSSYRKQRPYVDAIIVELS